MYNQMIEIIDVRLIVVDEKNKNQNNITQRVN